MRLSKNTSSGIKETYSLDKVYDSIEVMPIWNWIKVLETGDLKYVYKTKEGRLTKKLADHWLNLQQEYIDEFGFDDRYEQQIRLMKKLNSLNIEFVLTKDRMLLNEIKMIEADIISLNQQKAFNFYEVVDHVEKYKGFQIDPHKTSVLKWYYSLKNMSKHGKAD